jgi:hypothetical protein
MSGSYTDWYVGMEVVCVDDSPGVVTGSVGLVRGRVYVIEAFQPTLTRLGLRLVGVKHFDGVPWAASRFRKVQPRKTSIAIFERFLNDADAPIREDVG